VHEPPPLPRATTEPPELPAIPSLESRTKTENLRRKKTNDDSDFAHAETDVGQGPAKTSNPLRSHPRGSTPPSERSLISPPAETGAALDAAMARISLDDGWAELPDDDSAAERATPPVKRAPEPDPGTEIIVEAEPPPAPKGKRDPALSEPEISISALEDDGEPAETAKVVEVLQDSSGQTITMTIEEPSEPEIVIEQKKEA
jgi:hypothetical protein